MQPRSTALDTTTQSFFRIVFLIAAIYDASLGATFFFLYPAIFATLAMPLPNNTSYIHLTAAFVFVQGVSYWYVFRDMLRNVDIVKVGAVYKAVYSLVAVYYWASGELPNAIFAWFAVFDVGFLILFVAFLVLLQPRARLARAQAPSR